MGRTPEKHTAYFVMLDALRAAKSCPMCALEKDCAHRYFDSLLREFVNDSGVRGELKRAKGYCPRHAHQLAGHGDGLGTAILYRDQAELFRSFLKVLQHAPPKGSPRSELPWGQDHRLCPACREQKRDRERYLAVLVEGLHDEEMRSAFAASPGLCVPHFLPALEAAKDAHVRTFLAETQRARLDGLEHDLDEFCRKHDYRFRHEGMGKEGDSWRRAIVLMVGEEDVF